MAHIIITPHAGRVTIRWKGRAIATSDKALDLKEGGGAPVLYVPRDDADMSVFEKTAHSSHCPHKGDASYFSLRADGDRAENAVWSYETPLEAVGAIAGHLAFYPRLVTIEV